MTPREFMATGLTILFEWNGSVLPIGPKGTTWETLKSIYDVPEEGRPEAWAVASHFSNQMRLPLPK